MFKGYADVAAALLEHGADPNRASVCVCVVLAMVCGGHVARSEHFIPRGWPAYFVVHYLHAGDALISHTLCVYNATNPTMCDC